MVHSPVRLIDMVVFSLILYFSRKVNKSDPFWNLENGSWISIEVRKYPCPSHRYDDLVRGTSRQVEKSDPN